MNFRYFLNHKSKTITSAALILASAAIISRLLGLFRDRLLAGRFGAGDELDIYFAAFRIPDFIYSILIVGAISAAFIPVFTEFWHKDKKEAWKLTNGVLNIFISILILVSLILIVFCPQLINLVAPGFQGEKKDLTILLTRIMFLSPILLGISNIFSGVLQSFRRFFIYSLTPIMYNLGIISGIIIFVPIWGVKGLAFAVILGAFLHLAIQIPFTFFCGFRYRPMFNIFHPGIKKIIKLIIPRTIGLGANQINLIVITAIASTLTAGSIAVFNLSNNLQYILIGVVGISFATAAFPTLAKSFSLNQKEKFLEKFSSTFLEILFLAIPLSFLFFILRAQIVRIILGTGQFGWQDTRLTAAALGLFSLGIFAQCLIPLISRTFYAFQNTKTPVKISLVSIAINIILSFILVWALSFPNNFYFFITNNLKLLGIEDIRMVGLPLAFSLAGIFNLLFLFTALYKKIGDFGLKKILKSFFRILTATLLMAIVVYFILRIIAPFVNMQTFLGVFTQALGAGLVGIFFYCLLAKIFRFPELDIIINSVRRKL